MPSKCKIKVSGLEKKEHHYRMIKCHKEENITLVIFSVFGAFWLAIPIVHNAYCSRLIGIREVSLPRL